MYFYAELIFHFCHNARNQEENVTGVFAKVSLCQVKETALYLLK